MKCKECRFCTWACPGWMCMNKNHPDFEKNGEDFPVVIKLDDDACDFFCPGVNNYIRMKE